MCQFYQITWTGCSCRAIFTQGQVTNGNKPRSKMSKRRWVQVVAFSGVINFIRRLSSLLTIFCTPIIRTSIIEMHECKILTPRSCKLKLEVTEDCPNLPKWPKIHLLWGKCDQPAESGVKVLSLNFTTTPCSSKLIELAHYNRPL